MVTYNHQPDMDSATRHVDICTNLQGGMLEKYLNLVELSRQLDLAKLNWNPTQMLMTSTEVSWIIILLPRN